MLDLRHPLGLASEAPQAQRERAYIERLIADCCPRTRSSAPWSPSSASPSSPSRRRRRRRRHRGHPRLRDPGARDRPGRCGIAFAATRRRAAQGGYGRSCRGLEPRRPRHGALRPVIAADSVDTTVVAAFAVGFISFISPCVLPLVPGYLSTISGVSFVDIQEGRGRARGARPGAAVLPRVHGHVRRARHGRHRARPDAQRAPGRAAPGLGRRADPDGRLLHRHAVPAAVQPRVATRAADAPRPHRRPADRRRGVRRRLAALHRPDARRDPHRRLQPGDRRRGRRPARLLRARPGGAVHPQRARVLPHSPASSSSSATTTP